MSAQDSYYQSEKKRGWFNSITAIIGAVLVFCFVEWRQKDSETAKNLTEAQVAKAELRIKQQMVPLEKKLSELTAEKTRREFSLTEARTRTEEAQAQKATKPLVNITPFMSFSSAIDDVIDVHLDLKVKNVGNPDAAIESIRLEVLKSDVDKDAQDIIHRTQQLAQLRRIFDSQFPNGHSDAERADAKRQHDELHKNCPHGMLYPIAGNSKYVHWRPVPDLTETRTSKAVLRPEQSISETFDYVLTQNQSHHAHWYRIIINIRLQDGGANKFDFVIPTRQAGDFDAGTVVRSVAETKTRGYFQTGFTWTSESPLAPMSDGK